MEKKAKPLILQLFLVNKRWSLGILIVSIFSSLLNSVGLTFLVPILFQNFNISFSQTVTSTLTKVFDKYLYWLPGKQAPWMLLFVLILFIAKNALTVVRVKLISELTKKHMVSIRCKLLTHFLNKDIHFFVNEGSGSILTHLNSNVDRVARLMVDVIEFSGMAFQLVAYLLVLNYLSWKLCLICITLSAPLIFVTRRVSRKASDLGSQQVKSYNELAQSLSDLLHGIRFVKLSGREQDHIKWVNSISEDILSRISKLNFLYNVGQPITELAALGILLAMIVSLSFMGSQGSIAADSFFSYLLVLGRAMPLFNNASNKRVEIAGNYGAISSLEGALSNESYQSNVHGKVKFTSIKKKIEIKDMYFSYPDSKSNVLNAVSFTIEKGDSIAIVGPSGSGKSTLVDLLLGFYQPSMGSILVDGVDYRDFDIKSYRAKVALVPQEATMFFSTIRENLLYMSPHATEIDIWRALDQSDLGDFISKLPKALDTPIGEKGVMLSGGQKQRLSIARALLQNPEMLIFDEATSSLDSISETKIVDSIKRASVGRTSITIAHRLATILHCNKVVLIEHGWMVEQGSIQELLSRPSRFRKFAEAQNLKLTA